MNLTPGQQIGTYRVVRLLGQGGMGAVYEVEHTQLGVHYALKAFTFEGGHDEILKNKFLSEGKVLARLHDPHLVHVFDLDFDEATGTLYFVMDLVLGENGEPRTLADVRTADLDEDAVLRWFGELAAALDYIHAQGIVHRDIKLGNILLNADGGVVLSDFGVSRFFSQSLRQEINAVRTMVSEVTTSGHLVMGTHGYMAPEVERGEEATPASDAYSLGVMLVYLLTGIWYEPESKVFRLLETLEYRWADILPRMLAENPAERPTKLAELACELRSDGEAASPPLQKEDADLNQKRRGRRHPLVVVTALAAAFAIAAVGYFILSQRVTTAVPFAVDDFDAAFSVRGIYESPRK